jgi:hypothetical protein
MYVTKWHSKILDVSKKLEEVAQTFRQDCWKNPALDKVVADVDTSIL